MRSTLFVPYPSTQIAPPAAARPHGAFPTGIRRSTRFVRGSTRATVLVA
jgi:hypothetical protein